MVEPTCGHDVAETRQVEEPETAYEGTGAANAQVATAAGGATTGRALARCEEPPLQCAGRTERARRHCTGARAKGANGNVVAAIPTSGTMLQLATAGVYNPNPTDAVRERRASGQGGADGRGRTPGAA